MPVDKGIKLNFCFYRLPDMPTGSIIGFSSEITCRRPEGSGFLISRFYPGSPLIFIPSRSPITLKEAEDYISSHTDNNHNFPTLSTPKEKYITEVETMIEMERKNLIDKSVTARCIVMNGAVNLSDTFTALDRLYPHAFVFMFHTPESGLWMGASPESLIKRHGMNVTSDVLAGTKFDENEEWSPKNIDEHEVVARYIADTYKCFCSESSLSDKRTVKAGPVWHLRSKVTGRLKEDKIFLDLVKALSPTPALCGYPTDRALKLIDELEDFKREFYGGFCGPCSGDKAELYVNLRSGWFRNSGFCLYVGGGIMKDSYPESEWQETEKKARTMLNAIVYEKSNII